MSDDRTKALRLTALTMALDHMRSKEGHTKEELIELADVLYEYITDEEEGEVYTIQ